MRKICLLFPILIFICCTRQIINYDVTFLDNHTFDEVWEASIHAVNDIGFTIDSMDKSSGFLAAEKGASAFQDFPPKLSIIIKELGPKVSVDCKVYQKEYVDITGYGKKTVNKFMSALNVRLNR